MDRNFVIEKIHCVTNGADSQGKRDDDAMTVCIGNRRLMADLPTGQKFMHKV